MPQGTQVQTGESEQGASQISFHPSDANLLCSLGEEGLSLWHVDKQGGQEQLQRVPVQTPGKAQAAFDVGEKAHATMCQVG